MNDQKITVLLRAALDRVGAALVLAGGLSEDIHADEALDTALGAEPSVRDARRCVQEALQAFQFQGRQR